MVPFSSIFTILLLLSLALLGWTLFRRLRLVKLGKPEPRVSNLLQSLRDLVVGAFLQKRVLRKPSGISHLIFFWSFIVLLVVNGEFILLGIFPSMTLAWVPDAVYLPIRFVSDIMSLLALMAVAVALLRRIFFPPYADSRTAESFIILVAIGLHMAAYFGVASAAIVLGHERGASSMPVSSFVAQFLGAFSSQELDTFYAVSWWLHAGALLLFLGVLIPFSKHLHIVTALANCFLRPVGKPTVRREEFVATNSFGAGDVTRLTWKDLFDGFACAKCGRCQNACPAAETGKPLTPFGMIQAIRMNLLANGGSIEKGEGPVVPLIGDGEASVGEDAIWSCTTCGACMESCPVFVEHLPKLVGLRRHLVEMESRFPEELLNLFENMEQRSNPWGIAPTERTKWTTTLNVQPFEKGKTEYLYFVGCAGSFDSRQKHVTVAVATILDAAGVSWGILGKEEKCCGDSLRRLGNEYVFDRMAQENTKLFQEKGVRKIVTQCPHCYSTLKNDYRQYGLDVEVIHHSELIERLLAEGKLSLKSGMDFGTVAYHDPCYLGRHNERYDSPRKVIEAAAGALPVEMGRNRENSFCCGAGGGRMWIEEHLGSRINLNRVDEVLRKNPDMVCVACPYCMTMFEDGLKDRQAAQTKVKDLAEIVAERL